MQIWHSVLVMQKGKILCILEDDDINLPERLEHIKEIFTSRESLNYYHNPEYIMLKDGTKEKRSIFLLPNEPMFLEVNEEIIPHIPRLISLNRAGNPSCIAIRRNTLTGKLEQLKKVEKFPDPFLFFASLYTGKTIFIDNVPLTYLRQHTTSSSRAVESFKEVRGKRSVFIEKALKDRKHLFEVISDPAIKESFWDFFAWSRIEAILRSKTIQRGKMFYFGKQYLQSNKKLGGKVIPPFFSFIYILYLFFPNYQPWCMSLRNGLRCRQTG